MRRETQDASTTTKQVREKTHDYKAQKVQFLYQVKSSGIIPSSVESLQINSKERRL